jgi:hypothetical protein
MNEELRQLRIENKLLREDKQSVEEMQRMAKHIEDLEAMLERQNDSWDEQVAFMQRFADLVRADEREACAKVAEETICDTHIPTNINIYGTRAADAIRARSGEQK